MSVVTRFLTGLIAIVLVLVVLVDASKQTHQKETEIHASRAENALSKRKTTFSGPATWFGKHDIINILFYITNILIYMQLHSSKLAWGFYGCLWRI
jgi:hypothetical protein